MKSKRTLRPMARIRFAAPGEPGSPEIEIADEPDSSTLEPLLRDQGLNEIRAALSPDGGSWKLKTRRLQTAPFRIVDEVQPLRSSLRVFWRTTDPGVYLEPCGSEGEGWTGELAEQAVLGLPWIPLVSDTSSRAGRGDEPAFPCRLGASSPPRVSWHYVRDAESRVSLEIEWVLPDLPREWLAVLANRLDRTLACQVDDDLKALLQLEKHESHLLFRGTAALGRQDPLLPGTRSFSLHPQVGFGDPAADGKVAFDAVPMSLEIQDFFAVIGGEKTRYVSLKEDLAEPVRLLLKLAPRNYLPSRLPLEVLRPEGVFPWDFEAVEEKEKGEWRLTGASPDETPPPWREVRWTTGPLSIGIGCEAEKGSSALQRITNRKVKQGWEPTGDRGASGRLEVLRAAWWPRGLDRSLFRAEDGAYDGTVSLRINDLVERFAVDGVSELPEEPLFLDPYRWKVRSPAGAVAGGVRIYGHAGGSVWWLFTRSPDRPQGPVPPIPPAVWAAEGSPVLLIRDLHTSQRCWGALFVPSSPPAEHEIQHLSRVTSESGAETFIAEDSVAFLWIYLRGFFERYEVNRIEVSGEPVVVWKAARGLPLFPAQAHTLLRSLAPLYAVEGRDDELVLDADPERPSLRIGHDLRGMDGVRTIRPGPDTRCRYAWGADSQKVPDRWERTFPGQPSTLKPPAEATTFWLAVQPFERDSEVPFRFLLSWDAKAGWRFRGFYAPLGNAVRLGVNAPSSREARHPVLLCERFGMEARRFLLTIVTSGGVPEIRWSPKPPEGVNDKDVVHWFQKEDLRATRIPEALKGYQVGPVRTSESAIELELWRRTGKEPAPQTEPGIQVWAPRAREKTKASGAGQEDASETFPAVGDR